VWVCNSDGSGLSKLAEGGRNGSWSPDSSQIAFCKEDDINGIKASGGPQNQLTTDPAEADFPTWSADGSWIYFQSKRSGEQQVWRIPAGGGEAIQITGNGGSHPQESPDGKLLYYIKNAGLWRIPVQGGTETPIVEQCWPAYEVTDEGVYYAQVDWDESRSVIFFLSFITEETQRIASFNRPLHWGLSVSTDGQSVLYTKIQESEGDLMLVENFQ
jgi:Tol biopolymer transport system component